MSIWTVPDNYAINFINLSPAILQDTDNNFKTRYNIVTHTINSIIDQNIAFKNKLLAIAVLDPSYIPLELLDAKDKNTLLLLRELSRYSLINYNDTISSNGIALHRSVHHIIYLSLA